MNVRLEEIGFGGFIGEEQMIFEINSSEFREYVLGRSDKCHGKIRYETVSRMHCGVYPQGISGKGVASVVDLTSANGTTLNGKTVGNKREISLSNEDILALGSSVKFMVYLE
jgi:pSer/pThr/pTyr-binding forkhead associated (FHA) protein